MKRLILLVLMAMVWLSTSACGSLFRIEEPQAASGDHDADEDKLVLTVWNFGYPEDEAMRKIHDQIIEQYNKDHPNIKLVYQHYGMEYGSKIDVALASNEMPDIFAMLDEAAPLSVKMLEADVVGDLTKPLNADAQYKSTIMPGALEAFSYKGKPYAMPVYISYVQDLSYNREILNRYDIEPPDTWSELLAAVDKLYANGVQPIEGERYWLPYIALRLGGDERYKQAVAHGEISDELFQQSADLLYELREKHHAFSKKGAPDAGYNLFLHGEAAFTMDDYAQSDLFHQPDSPIDKMGFMPFPTIEGGAGTIDTSLGAWGAGFAMSAEAARTHQAEAYEAIKYLSSWKTREPITRIHTTLPPFRDFVAPAGLIHNVHAETLMNRHAREINRLAPIYMLDTDNYELIMSGAAERAYEKR